MASLTIESRVSLNFEVSGSGDKTLLLFNGATLPLTFWGSLADRLAGEFRVIRFDQRNAGQTLADGEFTLNDTAADAAKLLAHLDCERVIAIGHAWGGRAAQVFARDYPHLLEKLVICGNGGQLPGTFNPETVKTLRQARRDEDRQTWEACMEELYCAAGFRQRDPATFNELADIIWQWPASRARWNMKVSPSPSYWGMSQVPTLLVYGDQDKYGTLENARDLLGRLDDGQLEVIPDAGHFVVREQESAVAELLGRFAR